MQYLFMALFAAGIVAADQFSKYWVVHNVASTPCYDPVVPCQIHIEKLKSLFHVTDAQLAELPRSRDGIPGVMELSFVHNEGAAWSSLEGMIWLFVLIFAALTVAIVWEFSKNRMGFTKFERWCIVAIYGGGLGNIIDRLRLGFVVDMIDLEFTGFLSFLNGFPVFNVADCFITCGCIALMVHLVFFNKAFWKDGKK